MVMVTILAAVATRRTRSRKRQPTRIVTRSRAKEGIKVEPKPRPAPKRKRKPPEVRRTEVIEAVVEEGVMLYLDSDEEDGLSDMEPVYKKRLTFPCSSLRMEEDPGRLIDL